MQLRAWLQQGKWQTMIAFIASGAILFVAVNAPPHIQISFSQNRVMLAGKRMDNTFQNEKMTSAAKKEEMMLAVLELKRALEVEPQNEDANYNLARALEWLGNYSTALKLLQNTLAINPKRRDVAELIPLIAKSQQQGDTLTWEELPRTDF
jgi:tetratricopeptide (TPR) repeat protein